MGRAGQTPVVDLPVAARADHRARPRHEEAETADRAAGDGDPADRLAALRRSASSSRRTTAAAGGSSAAPRRRRPGARRRDRTRQHRRAAAGITTAIGGGGRYAPGSGGAAGCGTVRAVAWAVTSGTSAAGDRTPLDTRRPAPRRRDRTAGPAGRRPARVAPDRAHCHGSPRVRLGPVGPQVRQRARRRAGSHSPGRVVATPPNVRATCTVQTAPRHAHNEADERQPPSHRPTRTATRGP